MAQPLRRQVIVLGVILTVLVFSAIVYAARLTYQEHLRQLAAETSTMAATVVAYVNRSLQSADAVAVIASRHPSVQRLDPRAASEVLTPIVGRSQGTLRNAMIADMTGRVIAWAQPPAISIEGKVEPAWLGSVADRQRPAVSPLLGGPGDTAHAIVLAYPIRSEATGAAIGVFGISIHLESMERVLTSIPLPVGSVVTLTDEKSVVVARSLDATKYVGRMTEAPGQARTPSEVPSSSVRTGIDGVERVFGNALVERGPWITSVGIPTSLALERTEPIHSRNIVIAIGATGVVLLLSSILIQRWLSAFGLLNATARRVATGDLSPLEERRMPTAEMDQLYHTVGDMITSLRAARESIAAQVDEERRIRQEIQTLQQQVVRQERLAAIGVLVSGVAHELNNPLQAILGFSELLQMHRDMPETARTDLSLIQKESARASAIIRNLSRFGRQTSEPSPVRLKEIVASVMELRQRKLEELHIDVDVQERSRASVMAIFTELQQVLLNFAINAEQAIVKSGALRRRITIRTQDRDGWASVELEDTGPGVAPGDEAKLFQPFFTTKPVGEGTGLGLSVSYGIIQSHGGRLGYRQAPSGGAVFYFDLPIASETASPSATPS
ncbi:MAG: sensor histidine kinase [Vicinamibacterales bacterium]